MEYTPTQARVMEIVDAAISDNRRQLILWYGGIRAGKTYGAAMAIARHAAAREGGLYGIGAFTLRQIWGAIEPVFFRMAEADGIHYRVVKYGGDPRIEFGDAKLMAFSGGEAGGAERIQGLTLDGLFLDELANLDRDFVMQAEARTSADGALRIYTSNKPDTYHWTTRHYYRRAQGGLIEAELIDADTGDNQHLDPNFIAERESEYDDFYRARFLSNRFVSEGLPLYRPELGDAADGDRVGMYCIADGGRQKRLLRVTGSGQEALVTDLGIKPLLAADLADIGASMADTVVLMPETMPAMGLELRQRYGAAIRYYRWRKWPSEDELVRRVMAAGMKVDRDSESVLEACQYGDEMYTPALQAISRVLAGCWGM